MITEKKQVNRKEISMDVIYRTLPNLKTENRNIISVNYKLADLHYWVNHYDELEKYLQSLLDGANANINAINALIELYTESIKESHDKKCDFIEGISKMYDVVPDESKERICRDLIGKEKFFKDAYGLIMKIFEDASGEKDNLLQNREISDI